MAKRKVKSKLLTRIDPGILKPKPLGVSQHAAKNGARVTTAVNPVRSPFPTSLSEPFDFSADPTNFAEERSDDGGDDTDVEEVLKEFFASQVCSFLFPWRHRNLFSC